MIIEGGWTSGRGYDRQSKPCGQLCSYKGSHLVVQDTSSVAHGAEILGLFGGHHAIFGT